MKQNDRVLALDGLRGLAVIGVLFFHDGRLSGGFLGVDLFFALSGFLITGLLIDEVRRTGTVNVLRFWERRFRRLLPAVLALLVAVVPMMYLWGSPPQLSSAKHAVIPALLYVANWHEIFQGADYWALFTDPSPLTHLWSLAVEQQFYVVWPALFLLVSRVRRWLFTMTAACVAIIITSGALMWVLYDPANPNRAYEGTDTRASSILLGALLALIGLPAIIERLGRGDGSRFHPRRVALELFQWTIVAAIAWSWFTVDGATSSGLAHGGFLLHSAGGALLAATLATSWPTTLQRVLTIAPLRGAGAVSYGWYLWHWPIYILLTSEHTGWHGWALTGARWSASLAAAVASYYLIESPIRRRQWMATNRMALAGLAVAVVAIIGTVVLAPTLTTKVASFDPRTIGLPTTTAAPIATSTTIPGDTTVPGNTTVAPTSTLPRRSIHSVMWEGDSVAFDSAPGVLAAFQAAGLTASYHGFVGTGITPRKGVDTHAIFIQPVLDEHPDVVMLQFSGWDSDFPEAEQQAAFTTYTDAILGSGAALVFVTMPPGDPAKVTTDYAYMLGLAQDLHRTRPNDVFVLDANQQLWGTFAYDITGDGVPDRKKDGVHVCPQGSALLGNWLVYQFADLFAGVTPAPAADWAGGTWTSEPRFNNPAGTCS